ncbi:MAG: bifunctional diguanylate cyclase/phosphodiesterase, partial [Clostridia bacterium]
GYNEKLGLWLETTASVIEWKDGKPVYLIESADITEQKREHTEHIKQLERLAFVDELTGSRSFYKFKEDALKILELEDNKKHFLVKLDIENFKLINQIYGYEKGDTILCYMAKALEKTMRSENEIFARVFNDDFVALFTMKKEKDLNELFEVFLNNFYSLIGDDISFKFTFAYGIYIINSDDEGKLHINDLFEKVNVAHKVAKQDKTKNATIYNENMIKEALQTREVESKMTKALENNEFEVYLQPKYILESGEIGGAEALVRWNNENKKLFSPAAFISIFESNGFITKIDFYVLKSVCNIIKNWIDNGIEPVVISVNFSRIHLSDKDFVKQLCEVVEEIGIEKKYIEIELTETIIFENVEILESLVLELHQNGFTLSMDDFGSGYSSLGMLKNIKVDNIKMDRSFFANQKDPIRSKIVLDFIIKMAHTLGISIIAEGVEEKAQINLLKELQCDMVQGFYFAKPMPLKQFQKLIIHQQKKK